MIFGGLAIKVNTNIQTKEYHNNMPGFHSWILSVAGEIFLSKKQCNSENFRLLQKSNEAIISVGHLTTEFENMEGG